MALLKSEIREDLRSGPCEKCGERISEDNDHILSFYRGSFIILHEECADFMEHATKGPRAKGSKSRA